MNLTQKIQIDKDASEDESNPAEEQDFGLSDEDFDDSKRKNGTKSKNQLNKA